MLWPNIQRFISEDSYEGQIINLLESKFSLLKVDLIGLDIKTINSVNDISFNNIVNKIFDSIKETNMCAGYEVYYFIGWGVSASVEPGTTYKIIKEEIIDYEK